MAFGDKIQERRERRRERRADRKRRRAERKRDRAELLDERANELDNSTEQATLIGTDSQGRQVSQDVTLLKAASARRNRRIANLESKVRELEAELADLRADQEEFESDFTSDLETVGAMGDGFLNTKTLALLEAGVTALNASEAPTNPWALTFSEALDALVDFDQATDRDKQTYRLAKAALKVIAYWDQEKGLSGLLGNGGQGK